MTDALLRRTLPPYAAHVGSCSSCGKASYLTRRDARRAGKALHPNTRTRIYQCGALWHVSTTKLPRSTFRKDDDA